MITILVWYALGTLGALIYSRKIEPVSSILFIAIALTGPIGLFIAILSEKQKDIK